MRNTLLIIDDDELNRNLLKMYLGDKYETVECENGLQGLEFLRANEEKVAAIMLDLMMPVMNGVEFIKSARSAGLLERVPVFIVTAEPDSEDAKTAYEYGAADVIGKRFVPHVIQRRVAYVTELFEARERLSHTVESQQQEILKLNEGMVEALSSAIEFRSGETGAHVRNIKTITQLLLETDLGKDFSEDEKRMIASASVMHDLGKISIPDAILNKPGRFTPEEFDIMKKHSRYGADILSQTPALQQLNAYKYAYDIALHHHERWDGKGYPEGLKGDEISVWSQIVSLADVYDALISKRCYKEPFSREEAVKMINEGACGCFNPELLKAFMDAEPIIYERLYQ